MRITTLVENTKGKAGCATEHGLSLYIETKKHRILMDMGQGDLFSVNAKKLGIDLSKVDIAVVSHSDYDHRGGLETFKTINSTARIFDSEDALHDGINFIDEELSLFACDGEKHEQCLVIRSGKKRILVTGCAHYGIVNVMSRFKELYGGVPYTVVTGFHMMKEDGEYTPEEKEVIRATAFELAQSNTTYYTGHCTSDPAIKIMKPILGRRLRVLHTGLKFNPFQKIARKIAWGWIIAGIVALLVILGVLFGQKILSNVFNPYGAAWDPTDERILEESPINQAQVDAINALPVYSADDTWAIYIYMCGSDLESRFNDNLSDLTRALVKDYAEELEYENTQEKIARIKQFALDITSQGVDMPMIFYDPVEWTDSDEVGYADPEEQGFADYNLNQILTSEMPKNLKIVIQTGGSKRWTNTDINPNRSQRYVVDSEGFKRVYDGPIADMGDAETLEDFLYYCATEQSADHEILLFWNHGGATSGVCLDEITGNMLSMGDLREAMYTVFGERDYDAPWFEAVGFDACLMATMEVENIFGGYAKYMYASEETEPGNGWDYTDIIREFRENPATNGARIGKVITDGYVNQCMKSSAKSGMVPAVTFSVVDLYRIDEINAAYEALMAKVYGDVVKDPQKLAAVSRAANASIAFGMNYYEVYNELDLKDFMTELNDEYPEECEKVIKLLDESIVYDRDGSYLSDSTGLAVFYPAHIEGIGGLNFLLSYIDEDCFNSEVAALYYYKVAGCLSEELQEELMAKGYDEAPIINYKNLKGFSSLDIVPDGNANMTIKLPEEYYNLSQAVRMGLIKVDKDTKETVNYGEDAYAYLDKDGTIGTTFDRNWICLDGIPLQVEVLSVTSENLMLGADIEYGLQPAKLIIGYDGETQKLDILGVRLEEEGYGVADRNLITLADGDAIIIVKETGSLLNGAKKRKEDLVIYNSRYTKVEDKPLADGDYYQYVILEDLRSDRYYSQAAEFTVSLGKIKDHQPSKTFRK